MYLSPRFVDLFALLAALGLSVSCTPGTPHDPSVVVLAVPLHISGACILKLALR